MVATPSSVGSGPAGRTPALEAPAGRFGSRGGQEWSWGAQGLIAESEGHYDEAEYARQLQFGAPPAQ